MKKLQREIEQILNVYYVSPRASAEKHEWTDPRCRDCFCTIQERHAHSRNVELVKPLVELFKRYFEEAVEKIAL